MIYQIHQIAHASFSLYQIPDEDIISDKELGESSSTVSGPDSQEQEKQFQYQCSSLGHSSTSAETVC